MIEIKSLSFRYKKGSPEVLKNICLKIDAGEILSVLGKNGIGKTTLIKCITRELTDFSGSVLLDGTDIKGIDISNLSKYMAVVSANSLSYQNLCVADYLVTGFTNQLAVLSSPKKHHYKKASELLDEMGKGELLTRNIFELSSGEMQIVKIARAILQNPKVILFDEPTSNLDIKNQLLVLNQITYLKEKGYAIITTTHNPGQSIELGGKVLLMTDSDYYFGNTTEILTKENLEKVYNLNVSIEKHQSRDVTIFTDEVSNHKLIF